MIIRLEKTITISDSTQDYLCVALPADLGRTADAITSVEAQVEVFQSADTSEDCCS